MTDASPGADLQTAPVDERQPTPRWSVGWPILGWVCGIVGSAVTAGIAVGINVATGGEADESTLLIVVASMLGLWAAYGVVIGITVRRQGTGRPSLDLGLRFQPVDAVIGLGVGLASWIGSAVLYVILDAIGLLDADAVGEPARDLAELAHGPAFVVLFVFVVVGAPFVEEVFFRGFLQPVLVRNHGPVLGVGITGIAFGASHLQPVQTIGLAAFGVVLGVLAQATGRLGPSIVTHLVFNGLTMTTLFLTR